MLEQKPAEIEVGVALNNELCSDSEEMADFF